MKVSFWSPVHNDCAVTSNLACISILLSMLFSYKALLIENHQQRNRLENLLKFNTNRYYVREDGNYHYKHTGMNSILYQLSMGKRKRQFKDTHKAMAVKMIETVSYNVLGSRLFYIPYGNRTNKDIYDYDMHNHIKTILEASDEFADITFIDTTNKNNLSSKVVLEEADLIVVNLTQDTKIINEFLKKYSSILSKCVFLISNYNKSSRLNINQISQTHLINKSDIAAIPFNHDYQEALKYGKLIGFLLDYFHCDRKDPNYYFVKEVKNAAMMIYKAIEVIIEHD